MVLHLILLFRTPLQMVTIVWFVLEVPRCKAMMAGRVASDSLPLAGTRPHTDSRTSTPYYEGSLPSFQEMSEPLPRTSLLESFGTNCHLPGLTRGRKLPPCCFHDRRLVPGGDGIRDMIADNHDYEGEYWNLETGVSLTRPLPKT